VPAIDSRSFLAGVHDAARARPMACARSTKGWTPLFIVASPRPQSGKTFLARLIIDFLHLDDGGARAFDLNPGESALAEQPTTLAVRVDIDGIEGQMALFDRLIVEDGVSKVIDLGHTVFERFFRLMDEIDFLHEAACRAIEPVILYPADPHAASPHAYCRLRRRFPDMIVVPVFNDAILKGRRMRDEFPFVRAAAVPLQIPLLPPALKLAAERPNYSFADFHNKLPPEIPEGLAAELCSWTRRVFLELREFELRLMLEKVRASLRASAS
jgi:hypothetical protein